MPTDLTDRHYLPAGFDNRTINILLVGCGGNGGQMLMGLASLDTALRAISSRSLHVAVIDDDIVTEANLGRQPYYRGDVGSSKARTPNGSTSHTAWPGRQCTAAPLKPLVWMAPTSSSPVSTRHRPAARSVPRSPNAGPFPPIGWISAIARATGNTS